MKIVWICNDNTANNPYNIVAKLKKWGHDALLIQALDTYIGYPRGDYMASEMTSRQFAELVQAADVIHLNEPVISFMYPPELNFIFRDGEKLDILPLLNKRQRVFRHANGTYARGQYPTINQLCQQHNIHQTCSTPDLLALLPTARWLPQPIPLEDPRYKFSPPPVGEHLLISHCPTDRAIKGTDVFLQAMKGRKGVKAALIENKSHTECLGLRRQCPIHYDQFSLGAYGVASLEALAMGQVCIVGVSNVASFLGNHPFIDTDGSVSGMRASIDYALDIVKNRRQREKWVLAGRAWLEKVHGRGEVVETLIDWYKEASCFVPTVPAAVALPPPPPSPSPEPATRLCDSCRNTCKSNIVIVKCGRYQRRNEK